MRAVFRIKQLSTSKIMTAHISTTKLHIQTADFTALKPSDLLHKPSDFPADPRSAGSAFKVRPGFDERKGPPLRRSELVANKAPD